MKHKVRILVTHQLQFIRKADKILVLQDGKSIALGTFDELVSSGLDFVALLGKDKEKEKETNADAVKSKATDDLQRSASATSEVTVKAQRSVSRASSIRFVLF